jgi:hypothetical protein
LVRLVESSPLVTATQLVDAGTQLRLVSANAGVALGDAGHDPNP